MIIKGYFAIALMSAFVAIAGAAPAVAQVGSAEPVRVAQTSDYLPPASSRGGAASDYSDPQQISPRRGGNGEPLPPPPYAGSHSDADRDGEAATPDDLPPRASREYDAPPPYSEHTYSSEEIIDAGHRFFGGISKGLAKVVEYAFSREGRPNGYILGEEAGGAVVAGLRYGNGQLYTKSYGAHRVYWQGPSFGYDFGAEGSKTLILVYNLQDAGQIYNRFAGVDGSAYFIGGVGVTFQAYDNVVLAPIRSGVGLRLGANVGYLKYTRTPTWNPF